MAKWTNSNLFSSSLSLSIFSLSWTTVLTRRLSFLSCAAYKIITKRRPFSLFQSLAPMFSDVCRSQRLNTPQIEVHDCRTSALKNSFFITAATRLSSLPSRFLTTKSLVAFRTILREFLSVRDNPGNNLLLMISPYLFTPFSLIFC